jgi:hypothetical protein
MISNPKKDLSNPKKTCHPERSPPSSKKSPGGAKDLKKSVVILSGAKDLKHHRPILPRHRSYEAATFAGLCAFSTNLKPTGICA